MRTDWLRSQLLAAANGTVRWWPQLLIVIGMAAVVGTGVATGVPGAGVTLAIVLLLFSVPLKRMAKGNVPLLRWRAVDIAATLLGVCLVLIVSGGWSYVTKLDWSSPVPLTLVAAIAGFCCVSALVGARAPHRWRPYVHLNSLAGVMAGVALLALLVVSLAPVSQFEVRAQERALGVVVLDALRSGNDTASSRVIRDAYPGYESAVAAELVGGQTVAGYFPLTPVGPPTITHGSIRYRLRAGGGKGGFVLTVRSAEWDRHQKIWKVEIAGTAHKRVNLSWHLVGALPGVL